MMPDGRGQEKQRARREQSSFFGREIDASAATRQNWSTTKGLTAPRMYNSCRVEEDKSAVDSEDIPCVESGEDDQ